VSVHELSVCKGDSVGVYVCVYEREERERKSESALYTCVCIRTVL
jgi:hypothetical protein